MRIFLTTLILLLLVAYSAGCASDKLAGITAEGSSTSTLVALPTPTVTNHGDTLVVSGTVQRKPGADGPIPGYVSVTFLNKDRRWIDWLPAKWTPQEIPTTGKREAHYSARYGWKPPPGTIVRVEYSKDPLIGYGTAGPAGAAPGSVGVTGGSYYTQTPGTLGTPGMMGTAGTPVGGGSK